MTYDARRGAIENRYHSILERRERGEEVERFSRGKKGIRDGRLRNRLQEVFRQSIHDLREGVQGDPMQLPNRQIEESMEENGVLITTVRKMYRSLTRYRTGHGEEGDEEGDVDDDGEERVFRAQNSADRFCAEYIGFSDLSVVLMDDEEEEWALRRLQGGTFYKNKFEGGVANLTWGIVVSLQMVKDEVHGDGTKKNRGYKSWLRMNGRNIPSDAVLYELFFLFNMLHEHFHYLSELASLYDANQDVRYDVYDDYCKNGCKSNLDWECNLANCCKVQNGGQREFVEIKCKCYKDVEDGKYPGEDAENWGVFHSKKGYQYPVEEAMANAYAMNRLRNEGFDVKDLEGYIMASSPLGYGDFNIFRGYNSNKFRMGQRIMTRLMRGEEYPKVNQLQHEMLERRHISKVEELEEQLFTAVHLDNAYSPKRVHDEMKEVPLFVIDRDVGGNVVRWFNGFDPNGKMPRPMPAPEV